MAVAGSGSSIRLALKYTASYGPPRWSYTEE